MKQSERSGKYEEELCQCCRSGRAHSGNDTKIKKDEEVWHAYEQALKETEALQAQNPDEKVKKPKPPKQSASSFPYYPSLQERYIFKYLFVDSRFLMH